MASRTWAAFCSAVHEASSNAARAQERMGKRHTIASCSPPRPEYLTPRPEFPPLRGRPKVALGLGAGYTPVMSAPGVSSEPVDPGVTFVGGPEAVLPYLGQWVAIDTTRMIRAAGTTCAEALRRARAAGVAEPELLFVPRGAFAG